MARVFQRELARSLAFHLDHLAVGRHLLPLAFVSVRVGVAGLGLVNVEVFLIHREDGDAEGDIIVVAERDARQGRLACSDDVEAGRVESDNIAERGHAKLAVRIVGKDGAPGLGFRRRHDPVVGAFVELAVHQVGKLRVGIDGGLLLLDQRLKVDLLRRQHVVIQNIGGYVARFEASRHDTLVSLRIELAAQFVGIDTGRASDAGACDFGCHVGDKRVAADAKHIFRLPRFRLRLRESEFDRQRLAA